MDGINRFIRIIARLIVPIGIALFLRQYCGTGNSLRDSVVSTVAALVGMIPEGLVLLTSVVLAVSVIRLARKNALVQELYSIEMLARPVRSRKVRCRQIALFLLPVIQRSR